MGTELQNYTTLNTRFMVIMTSIYLGTYIVLQTSHLKYDCTSSACAHVLLSVVDTGGHDL